MDKFNFYFNLFFVSHNKVKIVHLLQIFDLLPKQKNLKPFIKKKIEELERLKKSILQKAFEGAL
ncbi:MAG: hypothetical protein K8R67_05625 [Desulfobacteraceae bacterium]|nr:hypothetical protein [Desulfobacteraceae bacterium]